MVYKEKNSYLRSSLLGCSLCTQQCTRFVRSLHRTGREHKLRWLLFFNKRKILQCRANEEHRMMWTWLQTRWQNSRKDNRKHVKQGRDVECVFVTWQPIAALRKVRTTGEMGAAPVNMRRTRPPRLSCRGQQTSLMLAFTMKRWQQSHNISSSYHQHTFYATKTSNSCTECSLRQTLQIDKSFYHIFLTIGQITV